MRIVQVSFCRASCRVAVTPAAASVRPVGMQTFTAAVTNTSNAAVTGASTVLLEVVRPSNDFQQLGLHGSGVCADTGDG